jgi:hypothetical protein
MSTNTKLSKTPTATPSHCAQIETLPVVRRPCRTTWAILRSDVDDEPLTFLGVAGLQPGEVQPEIGKLLAASH